LELGTKLYKPVAAVRANILTGSVFNFDCRWL